MEICCFKLHEVCPLIISVLSYILEILSRNATSVLYIKFDSVSEIVLWREALSFLTRMELIRSSTCICLNQDDCSLLDSHMVFVEVSSIRLVGSFLLLVSGLFSTVFCLTLCSLDIQFAPS